MQVFHIFLGFTAGRVVVLFRDVPREVARRLAGWSGLWLGVAIILDSTGAIPYSKNLWSLSFCLGTSGIATVLLLFFFLAVDAGKKSASAIAAGSVGRAKGLCSGGFLVPTGQNSIAL